jgi:hypothetical protein
MIFQNSDKFLPVHKVSHASNLYSGNCEDFTSHTQYVLNES